jgi:two-component system nitrogen regulation response regulator NtrX
MATDILIVDDEADIRELVSGILSDEGHGARTAKDSDEALAAIQARRPQLVFLDIWLQGSKLDFGPRQYRDGGHRDQARRL